MGKKIKVVWNFIVAGEIITSLANISVATVGGVVMETISDVPAWGWIIFAALIVGIVTQGSVSAYYRKKQETRLEELIENYDRFVRYVAEQQVSQKQLNQSVSNTLSGMLDILKDVPSYKSVAIQINALERRITDANKPRPSPTIFSDYLKRLDG